MKSILTQVIAVYEGEIVRYFTTEGIEIGTIRGGVAVEHIEEKPEVKRVGGVVTAKRPERIAEERDVEEQKLVDSIIHDNR